MQPLIKLQNLEKFYESRAGRTYVLRQISLEIQEGEFVTIMGPSGAGKSTLLHILGMLNGEWGGEYYFLDHAIHVRESVVLAEGESQRGDGQLARHAHGRQHV